MKTIYLFTITIFLISVNTYSQLDQKTWLVGGSGSFDSSKRDRFFVFPGTEVLTHIQYDEKLFELSPKVGFLSLIN